MRHGDGKPAANLANQVEKFDRDGRTEEKQDSPGLWSVSYQFDEQNEFVESRGWPLLFKPYDEASAVVGVSPLLRNNSPAPLTAIRRRNIPGSLVVHLQDAAGRPAAGYVLAGPWPSFIEFAASTDENGEVRLEGVRPGEWTIRAWLPGMDWAAADDAEQPERPLPADKELAGHLYLFDEKVKISLATESQIVIRPKLASYVRGAIRPAPGKTPADYTTIDAQRYDDKTGEFLFGPFAEGKTILEFGRRMSDGRWRYGLSKEVEIRGGRVTHADFDAPNNPQDTIEGTVYLPDGRTPAIGAQVGLSSLETAKLAPRDKEEIEPFDVVRSNNTESNPIVAEQSTDFQGRFVLDCYEFQHSGGPQDIVAVAWIPGRFGPAIVPSTSADPKTGLKIILPPSAKQSGKVTIGGKQFSESHSQLRVMAAREGSEPFNRLFRQFFSPDPEGDFELSALAPGVYRIQATLDNIWLSPSVRVTVGPDAAPLKPITLDIGEPGNSSTVTVVDKQGHGVPDIKVTLTRPEGPLASLLWPTVYYCTDKRVGRAHSAAGGGTTQAAD